MYRLSLITDEFVPLKHDLRQAIGLINDFMTSFPLFYIMFKMAKLRAIRQNFGQYRDNFVLALSLINTEARRQPHRDLRLSQTNESNQVKDAREKIKERSQERARLQATAERLTETLQSMGPSAIKTIARSGNEDLINAMKYKLRDSGTNEDQMEQILYPIINEIRARSTPTIEFVCQNATFNISSPVYQGRGEEDRAKTYTITREARFCCDRCGKIISHGTSFYHCGTCRGGV
jgi:hypothetical protein